MVTNGRKSLFLRNNGDEKQIDLGPRHDQREDHKDRELKTDAPGAIGQSAGYSGRVAYEETDFHQRRRTTGSRTSPTSFAPAPQQ